MTKQQIEPHKVTKPIQLLAAWLVGLILTNSIFLASALQFDHESWERSALVIAAISNVPIFLLAMFLLQTRFRPELQEDTYYAEYLSKKSAAVVHIDRNAAQDTRIEALELQLLRLQGSIAAANPSAEPHDQNSAELNWSNWKVALNRFHPKFDQIRDALSAARIPLPVLFGDTLSSAPSKWIVSISYALPIGHKIHLLRTILPYGFDGILFWEPVREADEKEDVYIGSYGDQSYVDVTAELLSMLDQDADDNDLVGYYEHNRKHRGPP